MQPSTDPRPDTATPERAGDTGTAAQAITRREPPPAPGYYTARLRYLQAQLLRARAEEQEHKALSAMYHAAQHACDGDRHMLATLADRNASNARTLGDRIERDIEALAREHPEALLGIDPHAVVTMVIRRDEITTRVMLCMGTAAHAHQTERRQQNMFWRCVDPEWIDHRDRLGTELVEFLESIDLPSRVADMLPRPATAAGAAHVAEAAAAMRS